MRRPRPGRRLLGGLLSVTLATAAGLAPAPSAAAAPVPRAPAFGSIIDPYSDYEPENTCDPVDKPGPLALEDVLTTTYGPATFYISRECVSGGSSGHYAGRAMDWMHDVNDPVERDEVDTFLDWLLATDQYGNPNAMLRRMGIMYIIWNRQIWEAYDNPPSWQPYTGSSPHTDHVHFSFSWDGAYKRTTYWNPEDSYPAVPTCATPPTLPAPPPVDYGAGLGYVPVTPTRLLDTRQSGQGVPTRCRLAIGGRLDLTVTGVGGVPAGGVGAVVLNVTGVSPDTGTYLTAYPAGTPWPGTSSVNVAPGEVTAALVVVPVGSDGKVSLLNGSGRSDAVVDIVGYHPMSGASPYKAITATRLVDTRNTGDTFGAKETRTLTITPVPKEATGVILNLVAVNSAAGGYLTATPGGSGAGSTSSLNLLGGRVIANRAYVALGPARTVDLYTSARTDVLVDVIGWFGPNGATRYVPITPVRAVDSRHGLGGVSRFTGRVPQQLDLAAADLPAAARSVVLTATATEVTNATYVTTWPHGSPQPGTSDINTVPGLNTANLVVGKLGDGSLDAVIGYGNGDLIGDVLGYFR